MNKILIGYLNDGRRYLHLKYLCDFLQKAKYCNEFTILVLSSNNDTSLQCIEILNKYNLQFEIAVFQHEYMPKINEFIKYALLHNFKYCFKMDNDIILPSSIYDFIYTEINILSDDVGIMLPTLYTSIPSSEYFIEDFLNDEEKTSLYKLFEEFKYTNEYNVLNDIYPKQWSLQSYFNMVENMKHPHGGNYKAIHPIRSNPLATQLMNEHAITHKESFFNTSKKPYLYICDTPHYFMPQAFIMTTDLLKEVLDPSLAYDGYDEVTLNNLIRKKGKKISFIRNCFGIHIAHNGYMQNFMEYEKNILNRFFENKE